MLTQCMAACMDSPSCTSIMQASNKLATYSLIRALFVVQECVRLRGVELLGGAPVGLQ